MKRLSCRTSLFLFIGLAVWLPAPVAGQPAPLNGLDEYITRAMEEWEIPGLSIAVVAGDSVFYARGYGVREVGSGEPVDEHTLFPIASTTKAFTAAAQELSPRGGMKLAAAG